MMKPGGHHGWGSTFYSDEPLSCIPLDFHIFWHNIKKFVGSNSFISNENWLIGDENQPRCV